MSFEVSEAGFNNQRCYLIAMRPWTRYFLFETQMLNYGIEVMAHDPVL